MLFSVFDEQHLVCTCSFVQCYVSLLFMLKFHFVERTYTIDFFMFTEYSFNNIDYNIHKSVI